MQTFKVGAMRYTIMEVPGLHQKYELFGQVTYSDGLIEMDADLSPERKNNVIMHELLHAMLFEAGYMEQDEEQVRRLANVMTQVLCDNDFGFMREVDEIDDCLHDEVVVRVDGSGTSYCRKCKKELEADL